MFISAYRHIKGYIEIEAKGFSLERFINIAIHNGVYLWDIQHQNTSLVFKVSVRDFRRLHRFAKKSGIKIRMTKKCGCPFFINRYRKRYVFLTGVMIFSLLLLYMSSFIWLIEINGNNKIEDYKILSVLSEKGLKTGAFKYALNTDELEQFLKLKIDGISWLHIKIDGTKATVTVTEEVENPINAINMVDTFSPCDIIADKDALITDIIATSGKPMVKPGDMVKAGDVLISADVTYLQDGADVLYNQVYASGTVKGKVTETLTYTAPYTVSLKRYTGQMHSLLNIKIFNANFNTNFLKKDVSFEKYDIIREIKQPGLGEKFILPVIIEKISYREYRSETLKISAEEAKQLALKALNKQIIQQYPTNSDILNSDISFKNSRQSVTAIAKITAVETIGKASSVTPITNQGGNAINGTTEITNSE